MAQIGPPHVAPTGLKTLVIGFVYYKHGAPPELAAHAERMNSATAAAEAGSDEATEQRVSATAEKQRGRRLLAEASWLGAEGLMTYQ